MTGMIRSPINFNRVIRACIQTGAFRLSVFDESEKKKKKKERKKERKGKEKNRKN